ncbi:hypothetical protein E2C01_077305 [Portunus trituberculatus]|uniref:Uncharacterized protein n=1 Tax=Portunus trituberculatus TaxID=210409 RepID=A0A5B7IL27_PORTR|nr:hypothetical protein [Portunus trituberculatus]
MADRRQRVGANSTPRAAPCRALLLRLRLLLLLDEVPVLLSLWVLVDRRSTVDSYALWGLRGLQAHGFEFCPRSECRLGFLTRGSGFLAVGL